MKSRLIVFRGRKSNWSIEERARSRSNNWNVKQTEEKMSFYFDSECHETRIERILCSLLTSEFQSNRFKCKLCLVNFSFRGGPWPTPPLLVALHHLTCGQLWMGDTSKAYQMQFFCYCRTWVFCPHLVKLSTGRGSWNGWRKTSSADYASSPHSALQVTWRRKDKQGLGVRRWSWPGPIPWSSQEVDALNRRLRWRLLHSHSLS